MTSRRRITIALVGLIVLVVIGWFVKDAVTAPARSGQDVVPTRSTGCAAEAVPGVGAGRFPVRPISDLPRETVVIWEAIRAGGPFRHPRNDNVTFRNREGILPARDRDYYREFTVPTPGERDRGARRLVTGGCGELYYTGDHYRSFVLVDPRR